MYASVYLVVISPATGLSPFRRQAITWTNVDILLTEPLETKFNDISTHIWNFQLEHCPWKCRLQMSAILIRPQCVKVNLVQKRVAYKTCHCSYH